jgi:hypothetical protein
VKHGKYLQKCVDRGVSTGWSSSVYGCSGSNGGKE